LTSEVRNISEYPYMEISSNYMCGILEKEKKNERTQEDCPVYAARI